MIVHVTKLIAAPIQHNFACQVRSSELKRLLDKACAARLLCDACSANIQAECVGVYVLKGGTEFRGGVNLYAPSLDDQTFRNLVTCLEDGNDVLLDLSQ